MSKSTRRRILNMIWLGIFLVGILLLVIVCMHANTVIQDLNNPPVIEQPKED